MFVGYVCLWGWGGGVKKTKKERKEERRTKRGVMSVVVKKGAMPSMVMMVFCFFGEGGVLGVSC